ncbi:hypothetical protein [Nocardia sp. X0981]
MGVHYYVGSGYYAHMFAVQMVQMRYEDRLRAFERDLPEQTIYPAVCGGR